jgi:hypothetical protein
MRRLRLFEERLELLDEVPYLRDRLAVRLLLGNRDATRTARFFCSSRKFGFSWAASPGAQDRNKARGRRKKLPGRCS